MTKVSLETSVVLSY